jgi:hypothetical protein
MSRGERLVDNYSPLYIGFNNQYSVCVARHIRSIDIGVSDYIVFSIQHSVCGAATHVCTEK